MCEDVQNSVKLQTIITYMIDHAKDDDMSSL